MRPMTGHWYLVGYDCMRTLESEITLETVSFHVCLFFFGLALTVCPFLAYTDRMMHDGCKIESTKILCPTI